MFLPVRWGRIGIVWPERIEAEDDSDDSEIEEYALRLVSKNLLVPPEFLATDGRIAANQSCSRRTLWDMHRSPGAYLYHPRDYHTATNWRTVARPWSVRSTCGRASPIPTSPSPGPAGGNSSPRLNSGMPPPRPGRTPWWRHGVQPSLDLCPRCTLPLVRHAGMSFCVRPVGRGRIICGEERDVTRPTKRRGGCNGLRGCTRA
ncbi:hypothetical protein B0H19DRAFT_483543 [Mycena capillaripes]|nr:hypothetical protein B0H19DRAFT_483543 [Mycena capillaripes]